MPGPEISKAAWRIEADTYPHMKFEDYRSLLIHETSKIRDFLTESRGEHFVISAPKGFGKTLLLIAKRKQIDDHPGYQLAAEADSQTAPTSTHSAASGGEFIDRLRGSFPEYNERRLNQFRNDYSFWKNLWWVSILIAAIKLDARSTRRDLGSETIECDKWIRDKLSDPVHFTSPTLIFTTLIEADVNTQQKVLRSARSLTYLFDAIHSQIAFFIDNVDEYFKPVLEDHGIELIEQMEAGEFRRIRAKSNEIWTLAQLGLAGTAYDIHKANSHIKVYCTIRREALIRLDEYDPEYTQILGCTVEIDYDRRDFREIFQKNIRLMDPARLFPGGALDPMGVFFGPANKQMKHRFVDQTETAFEYVLRHTFYRPRDLMMLGQAIASLDPEDRTPDRIKHEVDRTTDDLVKGLMSEMRPFFPLPSLRKLLPCIKTNVLTISELEAITREYEKCLGIADENESEEEKDEYNHPFCVLHKVGMLGWINVTYNSDLATSQRFVKPREIAMRNHIGLPITDGFYVIHPALDHLISELAGAQYFKNFHRSNIVGNEVGWIEPATSQFVIMGDLCGFSLVMSSEFYRAIARKMYEWSEAACAELDFYEVGGGDSIVMIDKSADRIVRSAFELIRRASLHKESSLTLTFRFGGAAGPIGYEELRRRVSGRWERLSFPVGLSLRTSARLEPHAGKGFLMVEERFAQQCSSYLKDFVLRELDGTEVSTLKYLQEKRVFEVQKNSTDPVYETKLYRVEAVDSRNPPLAFDVLGSTPPDEAETH